MAYKRKTAKRAPARRSYSTRAAPRRKSAKRAAPRAQVVKIQFSHVPMQQGPTGAFALMPDGSLGQAAPKPKGPKL